MAAPQSASLDEAIASLTARLREDPDNAQGWFLLGLAFREARRLSEAEGAFRRAFELAPGRADHAAYLGEMLVLRAGGNPPAEAESMFRRALAAEPGHAQARYYLATLKDLRGDHRGAADDLIALLEEAPADAAWRAQVRGAILAIAQQNNLNLAARLPPEPAAARASATAAIPGPTRAQIEAARSIPPGEQDAMVRAMVERLASRLRQSPRDEQGWIRLMRSRMVLGEREAAATALRSSLAAFAGDTATQQRLRSAAAQLGVPAA
ncbi:MAG: tetratricopeptide repeat protein [Sphingosinicella sp.]